MGAVTAAIAGAAIQGIGAISAGRKARRKASKRGLIHFSLVGITSPWMPILWSSP